MQASSTSKQMPRQAPRQAPRPTPTRDIVPHGSYKRKKRPSITKPLYPKAKNGSINGNLVRGANYQSAERRSSVEDDRSESRSGRMMRKYYIVAKRLSRVENMKFLMTAKKKFLFRKLLARS